MCLTIFWTLHTTEIGTKRFYTTLQIAMETSKRLFPVETGYVNLETDGFFLLFSGAIERDQWREMC